MNYSDDDCMTEFTEDQKERMFAAFTEFRGDPITVESAVDNTDTVVTQSENTGVGGGFPQPGGTTSQGDSGLNTAGGGSSTIFSNIFSFGGTTPPTNDPPSAPSGGGDSGLFSGFGGFGFGSSGGGDSVFGGGFGTFLFQSSTPDSTESGSSSPDTCAFKSNGAFCFSNADCCSGVCGASPFGSKVCLP